MTRGDDASVRRDAVVPSSDRRGRFIDSASRLTAWITVGALAWGTFLFGGVYPWVYVALVGGCLLAGLLGIAAGGVTRGFRGAVLLPCSLATVAAAVALQLVPLPASVVDVVSPAAHAFRQQYQSVSSAAVDVVPEPGARYPISISAEATWRGLAFLLAFGPLLIGLSFCFRTYEPARVVRALLVLGLMVALVGIVQKPFFNGRLYGFWQPRFHGIPFGPFMNRNHFAGWMLMMIPLAVGYLLALLSQVSSRAGRTWRERVLWFSTAESNGILLAAACISFMTLSLVLTLSRSGIGAFAGGLSIAVIWTWKRHRAGRRAAVMIAMLLVSTVAWVGGGGIVSGYANLRDSDFAGRGGVWTDTVGIVRDFPLTGTGFNTYGVSTIVYQKHYLEDAHMNEAHNDYLQIAAEGGLMVGVPVMVLLGVFVREVAARFRRERGGQATYWVRFGAVTGLVSIAIQELVDFSLQMPANAILFTILCAVAIHRPGSAPAGQGVGVSRGAATG